MAISGVNGTGTFHLFGKLVLMSVCLFYSHEMVSDIPEQDRLHVYTFESLRSFTDHCLYSSSFLYVRFIISFPPDFFHEFTFETLLIDRV